MSMKPGATTQPVASLVRTARAATSPTATIRSPRMATSPGAPGAPLPSTTVPPRIRRSQSIGPRDVVVQDEVPCRLRQRGRVLAQHVLRPGPGGVAVREIVRPHQAFRVLQIDRLERGPVVLEGHVDVLAEDLRRPSRQR